MKKSIIIFLIIFVFVSCSNENTVKDKQISTLKNDNSIDINDSPKIIDTTIILTNIPYSDGNCDGITEKEAEKFLFKFFKSKGALPRNEIKDYSKENLCIDYDTIYNIKSNKTCSAIIRYWLTPADLNGICVQPFMAIISKTGKSITITNEEFVNQDFVIDSIAENQTVYGYTYDCSEHKLLKNYKLKLEIK